MINNNARYLSVIYFDYLYAIAVIHGLLSLIKNKFLHQLKDV